MPFPTYSSSSGYIAGAPVRNTTYGNYNYYSTPRTIGTQIGGGTGGTGGGSSTTQTGNADAEAWFKGVMGGQNLPFSPFAQSQMLSQQSDMSAAAEGARNQQLTGNAAAGGASANDPSLRAGQMSNMAARQGQNQTAARDISANANQANFGAQMQAASQLNNNAMQRAQWAQSAGSGGIPFSPFGSGQSGGGGSTPSMTVGMGFGGGADFVTGNRSAPGGYGTGSTYEQRMAQYRQTPQYQNDYNTSMAQRNVNDMVNTMPWYN